MKIYRPTWVEISKSAFTSNVQFLKSKAGENVHLLAVLKADAYGHGAFHLAPLAMKSGASILGVSSLEEGLSLRQEGIQSPILLLGGIFPLKNFDVALQANLIPTVASLEAAQGLSKAARRWNRNPPFHLKVDTGMGRIGVTIEGARKIFEWLKGEKNLALAGVYSHLASADSSFKFTLGQLKKFDELKRMVRRGGFTNTVFHLANSAGLLGYPTSFHEMVRPGLALYGITPFKDKKESPLSPVLSWQSKAIFLKKVPKGTPISYGQTFVTKRKSELVTLPVGYADGVPRSVSNKGFVLIRGKRCPMVGRVTMDHLMVDVTGLKVKVGEPVVLIGKQGSENITVREWADWAETIPYEIFCGLSKRVPRILTA